ncbi:MAG: hypothetical protein ACYC5Y_08640 [Symbiobacteriia bacterium]
MRDLALWLTLTVIVGYGSRYLRFPYRWLPYLNRAAMPVYVIGVKAPAPALAVGLSVRGNPQAL